MTVGDLNGDGADDVVSSNFGTVGIMAQDDNGLLEPHWTQVGLMGDTLRGHPLVMDFNLDGRQDMVYASVFNGLVVVGQGPPGEIPTGIDLAVRKEGPTLEVISEVVGTQAAPAVLVSLYRRDLKGRWRLIQEQIGNRNIYGEFGSENKYRTHLMRAREGRCRVEVFYPGDPAAAASYANKMLPC